MIAAWPSFALIAAYELLMRQVRHSAAARGKAERRTSRSRSSRQQASGGKVTHPQRLCEPTSGSKRSGGQRAASRDLQQQAWLWALANRTRDGSLPSGRDIARQYGRHERWGRLVKRSGSAGEFASLHELGEAGLRLVGEGGSADQ